ncbi:MAG: hypothetical protein AAFQ94_01895 [Bacteroidota bacterium]
MTEISATDNPKKLFSSKAINIATFLGGPLAASILMRRNFINLGNEKAGLMSVIIGMLTTMVIIIALILIPESTINKVPSFIIPAIYTAIVMLLVERTQGEALKRQKEIEGGFYSGWKAAGLGLLGAVIYLGAILGVVLLAPLDPSEEAYNEMITDFSKTEENALVLFDILERNDFDKVPDFISYTGIPAWRKNQELVQRYKDSHELSGELLTKVGLLERYCNLRIESFELIRKIILEDTNQYDAELDDINQNISTVIELLD